MNPFVSLLSAVLLPVWMSLSACTALSKMGEVMLDPSIPVGAPNDHLSHFSLSLYASPTLNLNPDSTLATALTAVATQSLPLSVSVNAGNPAELADKLQALLDGLRWDHPAVSVAEFDQPPPPAMSSVVEVGSYQDSSVHLAFSQAPPLPEQVTTPIAFQVLQLKDDSMLLNATYEALAQDLKTALGSTVLQVDDYRLMPGQFKFVELEEINKATRYLAVIAHYHERNDTAWKRVMPIAARGHRHALMVHFEKEGVVLKGQG